MIKFKIRPISRETYGKSKEDEQTKLKTKSWPPWPLQFFFILQIFNWFKNKFTLSSFCPNLGSNFKW